MEVKMIAPGLIGLVLFIIIFNVYHIIKNRKKNMRRTDAIDAYKSNYKKKTQKKPEETDDYIKFITKYNSSVDFIDKDTFIEEAMEQRVNQGREIYRNGQRKKSLHNNFM